ncbi:sensor histidine kinase [Ectothiorhodospiraceae bacterium 2226]|nr:sensor histidine kinase [Ectothiorhodospiraceae bacterium 2226]
MTLRSNIFWWVFLSTVVPLIALVLAATYYAEHSHRNEVSREVDSGLRAVVSEVGRRLQGEREIILGLAESPALTDYLPVLADAADSRLHAEYGARSERLNAFLEDVQNVLTGIYSMRVLDVRGNTLLMVRNARRSEAAYDSLDGIPLVEQEVQDAEFMRTLAALPPGQLGYALLPQRRETQSAAWRPAMLDYVVPLAGAGEVIGYLAINVQGAQLDRILDFAPRPYQGRLFIAEVNPEDPARHGALLYDDHTGVRFGRLLDEPRRLNPDHPLLAALDLRPHGMVRDQYQYHFVEYYPYPTLLVSWVVASRVDPGHIGAPFNRIRIAIVLFAVIALLAALGLAQIGARRLAGPVSRLAHNLKAYADNGRRLRLERQGLREIDELQNAFTYMADTLEKARAERDKAQAMMLHNAKLASIGQLAAGIGHELNNPLNNILSLSKLVGRTLPDDAPARQDLDSLREETLRAGRIVQGILNFARQVPPQVSVFEADAWLAETVALVEHEAQVREVVVAASNEGVAALEGDRGQLQQALINLLRNAIQASPTGAVVRVTLGLSGEDVRLEIQDQGPGIDPGLLERVFDPFFTTKDVGEGSGLGLSISLGIVERHGGSLQIENTAPRGARATLRLPAAAHPAPPAAAARQSAETKS